MKIGIISDTHDNIALVEKAMEIFSKERIGYLIHCGDIISPFMVKLFNIECPKRFLYGNNKGDMKALAEKIASLDDATIAEFQDLQIAGKRIAVVHGDEAYEHLFNGPYDCVATGHTHKAVIERIGKILHINPGGLARGFAWVPSIAIYDTEKDEGKIINL
jgi:uncharacterized protein